MENEFKKLNIRITAPRKEIWKTVTDFSNYPEWNTIVPYGGGKLKAGNSLLISMRFKGKTKSGWCMVNEVVPEHNFSFHER